MPDLDDLRKKIDEQMKGLVLIHPNNPTGALYDEKTLKEIVDIADEYDLPLISDEIYGAFIYDGAKFDSLAMVAGDVQRLVMYSISKAYVATGWRVPHRHPRPRGEDQPYRRDDDGEKCGCRGHPDTHSARGDSCLRGADDPHRRDVGGTHQAEEPIL